MILIKFEKTFPQSFEANLDFQRSFKRIFRRAGVEVGYTGGFNPHMDLNFTPPLPLGIDSFAEYATAVTDRSAEEIKEIFDREQPNGVKCVYTKQTGDVNVAADIVAADYEMPIKSEFENAVAGELKKYEFLLTYEQKGKEVTKNVKDKILGFKVENGILFLRLAAGFDNLRIDRMIASLNAKTGMNASVFDAKKTCAYASVGGELIPFDEYFGGAYEK